MSRPGRNDPCPCGSGRKFKHCCLHKRSRPVEPEPALSPEAERRVALHLAQVMAWGGRMRQ